MGDPKKPKKKYSTPSHPWEKARIDAEKAFIKEYGLVNKREIWRVNSLLSKFKAQAKKCAAADTPQLEKEKQQLITRVRSLGLLDDKGGLDEVLGLRTADLMKRRLQSVVFEKKLASTAKQARQAIVHGHVSVGGRKVTVPGHYVHKSEEAKISVAKNE